MQVAHKDFKNYIALQSEANPSLLYGHSHLQVLQEIQGKKAPIFSADLPEI